MCCCVHAKTNQRNPRRRQTKSSSDKQRKYKDNGIKKTIMIIFFQVGSHPYHQDWMQVRYLVSLRDPGTDNQASQILSHNGNALSCCTPLVHCNCMCVFATKKRACNVDRRTSENNKFIFFKENIGIKTNYSLKLIPSFQKLIGN